MALVEVILGKKTSARSQARALDLLKLISKTAIVANDGPGFYTSRVIAAYTREALGMLAAAWVVPGLIGPGLAGLLVEISSWRMTFWIVPLLLVIPTMMLIPELIRLPVVPSAARTDATKQIVAVLVAIAALALFQAGASHVGRWPALNILLIAILPISVAAWDTTVLMPKGFLRIAPGIPAVVGMRGVVAGAFFAAEIYVPLALQEIRGVSVALSGGVLTAAKYLVIAFKL